MVSLQSATESGKSIFSPFHETLDLKSEVHRLLKVRLCVGILVIQLPIPVIIIIKCVQKFNAR